jgi:hypothetical protein
MNEVYLAALRADAGHAQSTPKAAPAAPSGGIARIPHVTGLPVR